MMRKFSLIALLLVAPVLAQPQGGRADAMEAACKDKSSGDDCDVIQGNHTFAGECFSGGPADSEHTPPLHCRMIHPAEASCKKKSEGDECTFSRPGDPSKASEQSGKCASTPHGSLSCRPANAGRAPGFGDQDGILPPHLACQNLTVGDECKTHGPDDGIGICTRLGRGGPASSSSDGPIHCRSLPPMEKACQGKSADDACSITRGGAGASDGLSLNGTCAATQRDDNRLSCLIHHGRSRLDALSPQQQTEFETKMKRMHEIRSDPDLATNSDLQDELASLRADVAQLRGTKLRGGIRDA